MSYTFWGIAVCFVPSLDEQGTCGCQWCFEPKPAEKKKHCGVLRGIDVTPFPHVNYLSSSVALGSNASCEIKEDDSQSSRIKYTS